MQKPRRLTDENSVSFQMFLILLSFIALGSDNQISVFKHCQSNTKQYSVFKHCQKKKKRLKSYGPNPGITTPEILQREKTRTTVKGRGEREDEEDSDGDEDGDEKEQDVQTESKFAPPKRTPMTRERRKMVSLALETAVLAVMNGHLYSYDNKVRKQRKGGPIGLLLTGVLAKLVMLIWAREFIKVLATVSATMAAVMLYMLKVYVDDVNVVTEELPPGTRFIEGLLTIIEEEVENDNTISGDIRTAKVLQEVANSILPYLKFTVDSPSNHPDGWMPVLDLKVRVQGNQIQHAHYRKPMCDRRLIIERSAHPTRVKRLTAVCEGLRILLTMKVKKKEFIQCIFFEEKFSVVDDRTKL